MIEDEDGYEFITSSGKELIIIKVDTEKEGGFSDAMAQLGDVLQKYVANRVRFQIKMYRQYDILTRTFVVQLVASPDIGDLPVEWDTRKATDE